MRDFREAAARWRHGRAGGGAQPARAGRRPLPRAATSSASTTATSTTFEVTLETSLRLAEFMPAGALRVSESGIHERARHRPAARGRLLGVSGGRAPDEIGRPGGGAGAGWWRHDSQDLRHHQPGGCGRGDGSGAPPPSASTSIRRSPRYIAPERAAEIATPARRAARGRVRRTKRRRGVEEIGARGVARCGATARRRNARRIIRRRWPCGKPCA